MRHKLLFTLTLSLLIASSLFSQQPIILKITDYQYDMRYSLCASIANDSHIDYVIDDENDVLLLFSADRWHDDRFFSYVEDMKSEVFEEYRVYETSDKDQQGERFTAWKTALSDELFSFLFKLTLMESPMTREDNQTCATSDPFCTSDIVTFHVDANPGGSCETGPYYGCLSSFTQRPPFWFHMKIGVAGNFTIRMSNSSQVDIDYCCWGPFNDPITPCPNQLTQSKYIDCGASGSDVESCVIPSSAQVGQYYILVITKYNQTQATNITFQKVANSGPGETDCTILPPLVDNDGPFCVGDVIHLTGNAQSGASYHWTGPNGFSSNQQNPVLNNCTMTMSGTYTCTITVGSQSSNASTEVRVYAKPTANFEATSVCQGNTTQFTNTSTSTPAGYPVNHLWDFGDGQSSSQTNPTHQYATAGNYNVTLTASCGNGVCTDTKTQRVSVYSNPTADAGEEQVIDYGATAQLHGSGGTGIFNYHWEPANKVVNPDAQNTQTINLTETTTFTLTVTNAEGTCSSSDQVNILVSGAAMTASASANPSAICLGSSTQLHANAIGGTSSYTYSWSPTIGLGDPHSASPIAYPSETTTYTCVISDGQTSQSPTVTVTVNYPVTEEETQYICPGETYNFYGQECSEPHDYEYHTTTAQGCEKTIILHLIHYPDYEYAHTTTEAICSETSYLFHGHYYNTTGVYHETLQTEHGCDSTVWLNLTVYPPNDTLIIEPVICESQSYHFHGQDYNQDGQIVYFDTIDNHGCPRVEKLILTVGPYQVLTQNEYLCYTHEETPSFYWDITQQTYTEDTYDEIILPDPEGGCDIKYKLNLKFHQEYYDEQSVTECDSYYWPVTGQVYTSDTKKVMTYPGGGGSLFNCDSTFVLDLTINHSYEGTKTVTGQCDEYLWDFGWNHESYPYTNDHSDNEWTRTIPTIHGCDSTVTLRLQIDHSPNFPEVIGKGWVVGGSEFQYNIEKYWVETHPESTHLTEWYFNDPNFNRWQIVPFGLSNDSCLLYIFTFEKDSIELCARTQGPCGEFSHSKWIHCSFHEVPEAMPDLCVEIFPNPNDGEMTLSFKNMASTAKITVFDLSGTTVDQFEVLNPSDRQTHYYNASHLPPGVYFFRILSQEGALTKRVIILK